MGCGPSSEAVSGNADEARVEEATPTTPTPIMTTCLVTYPQDENHSIWWMCDPMGNTQLEELPMDLPRHGSGVRGIRITYEEDDWLQIIKWRQAGSLEWVDAPPNAYLCYQRGEATLLEEVVVVQQP